MEGAPGLFKRCIAECIGTALVILIGPGTAAFNGIITASNNPYTGDSYRSNCSVYSYVCHYGYSC
ncbi:hypothetical protein ACIGC1_22930 [Peribacillus butanolivorans]|uniref:hypothetical protein n=1 Tax=Peribacillus butanolivorans TaxID=421767 RepID=UPI0037C936DB